MRLVQSEIEKLKRELTDVLKRTKMRTGVWGADLALYKVQEQITDALETVGTAEAELARDEIKRCLVCNPSDKGV